MALSNFAATAPNLAQYSALSELKPLSFAGGMQSPLEFRTMSAIRPPDAQPEAVAQGVGQALGSLAEGVTAAFKSKAEEKKDQLKFQRDKELARIKSADSDARLDESERHNRAMEAAALARVKEVTSLDFGDTSYKGTEEATAPAEPKSQAPEEPVRFFGSDPETKYMGRDANVTPEGVPLSMTEEQTKALSGLTPDISERSNRGMLTAGLSGALPYTGLSDLDAGKIFAQYNVSSSPLGIPNSAPIQKAYDLMLDEYRQDALTNTLAEQKQFGTLPPPELTTPKSETPALSDLKPVSDKVPRSTFDSYPEAQKYMEDQAGNPNWYASGTPEPNKQGKFVIPWKQNDPELRASRKARESQQAAGSMKPEDIFKQEEQLRGDYVAQSKNFQVLQSAWNNLKGKVDNPTGASDMSLIFAYMKLLDPTSTIREGEYATASNVGTIPQTFIGKYNKAVEGNGFLDPKVRESFIKEAKGMYKSSLSQHKQSTDEYKRIAKSYGLEPDRVIINLVTKDEADQANEEMEALGQELNAVADKDRATYPDFQAKRARYKALLKKKQDQEKLTEQAKSAGTQTPSTPQNPNAKKQGILASFPPLII